MGNFESRKYSKGNQCDVTPRLPNKTEGLTKNGWHEFYWTWISMADCPAQKGTCGGLGIEAERMDFGIGHRAQSCWDFIYKGKEMGNGQISLK